MPTPEDRIKRNGTMERLDPRGPRLNGARKPVKIFTMAELQVMTFPPIAYVVPGVVTEGLTLFAGKPKGGKSYMALGMAVAVAAGGCALGSIQVEQGDALMLSLEDNARRLHARMTQLLGDAAAWPARLSATADWPRLHEGGLEEIERWIARVERPRLVVVDVLGKVRPPKLKEEQLYDWDYRSIAPLKQVADQHRVAMIVVHHVSKRTDPDDPFDTVSGSTGLTGAADSVLILRRGTETTQLYGRGRDMPEIDKAVRFDDSTGSWTMLGDREKVEMSDTRKKILDVIEAAFEPCSPKEIAAWTRIDERIVSVMLTRMVRDGEIEKLARGKYGPRKRREE